MSRQQPCRRRRLAWASLAAAAPPAGLVASAPMARANAATVPVSCTAGSCTATFGTPGVGQSFPVPAGVSTVSVTLYAGVGGTNRSGDVQGRAGAKVTADLGVTAGQDLAVPAADGLLSAVAGTSGPAGDDLTASGPADGSTAHGGTITVDPDDSFGHTTPAGFSGHRHLRLHRGRRSRLRHRRRDHPGAAARHHAAGVERHGGPRADSALLADDRRARAGNLREHLRGSGRHDQRCALLGQHGGRALPERHRHGLRCCVADLLGHRCRRAAADHGDLPPGQPDGVRGWVDHGELFATDKAGNVESPRRQSVLVLHGLSCTAPTPAFTVPGHGSAIISGTVTIRGDAYPYHASVRY